MFTSIPENAIEDPDSMTADSEELGRWTPDNALLLIYKDPLDGELFTGSSLTGPSYTIDRHLRAASGEVEDQLEIGLEDAPYGNPRVQRSPPTDCAVWGWWRKPWESHDSLFKLLKTECEEGRRPDVILYNQYQRRAYEATLHDLYWESGLTSSLVPAEWQHRCPDYYNDQPHLCGAFFALGIDNEEIDAGRLDNYYLDARSFQVTNVCGPSPIIPPPIAAQEFSGRVVDEAAKRKHLRRSERTIFVLRDRRQRERTAELLSSQSVSDERLAEAFRQTSTDDLFAVLRETPFAGWQELASSSEALSVLGEKCSETGGKVTRYDFELVADLHSAEGVRAIVQEDTEGGTQRNALSKALGRWVTSSEERASRDAAAEVFFAAWCEAADRYELVQLPEKYFKDVLPAMEAVSSAVKFDIGEKFYRDHLSHNVRAALLSATLWPGGGTPSTTPNGTIAGFFAGLFHDLTMPITSFPETVSEISDALSKTDITDATSPRIETLVDRSVLQNSLSYVALLSSIRNIQETLQEDTLKPWEDLQKVIDLADSQILVEELLCASTHEHSVVSAALVFNTAVRAKSDSRDGGGDYSVGLRSVLQKMSGRGSEPVQGVELAQVIQAMALHDRREAGRHHAVEYPPESIPKPLSFEDFKLAAVVSIADEFQEWGRTLGPLDKVGVVDGEVSLNEFGVDVRFKLSTDETLFQRVPFSLLEYMLGKIRTVGKYRGSRTNDGTSQLGLKISLEQLEAFKVRSPSSASALRIDFSRGYDYVLVGDRGEESTGRRSEIRGSEDSLLVQICCDGANWSESNDYLLLEGGAETISNIGARLDESIGLDKLSYSDGNVIIEGNGPSGARIEGELVEYWFGEVETAAPTQWFESGKMSGVGRVRVEASTVGSHERGDRPNEKGIRNWHPHFLDFDWRFSEKTAEAIASYVAREVTNSGKVCYLACPTIALAQERVKPEVDWRLLDRGHFALEQCIGSSIPRDWVEKYDVFKELPDRLRGEFEVVITDPPWYDPYYSFFASRASALLTDGGVLGITYYPPALDEEKAGYFKSEVFEGVLSDFSMFGSMEIDYSVPEFERLTSEHKKHYHGFYDLYRPGYMDFLTTEESHKTVEPDVVKEPRALRLTGTIGLENGHHLKYDPDIEFPVSVRVGKRGIERPKSIAEDVVAWSSHNLVLRADGEERRVEDLNQLKGVVTDIVDELGNVDRLGGFE